ncbi:MAG: M14 family zinc carboxypeptidase [Candidatus Zixiibacteriota bacterium]
MNRLNSLPIVCLLISLAFVSQVSAETQETVSQIEINNPTKKQLIQIWKWGLDVEGEENNVWTIFAKPADLEQLSGAGIPYSVSIADMQTFYKSRNKDNKAMGGFRTFSEIVAYLDSIQAAHPTIMTSKVSLGTTLEGRNIWMVKVSDNPGVDEAEPELLYISLIHAREPAAPAAVLYFIAHLLDQYGIDPEVTDIVNNRELYFVPMQNPDGYVYNQTTNPTGGGMWRKNRRNNGDATFGVDCNRNYGYKWGFDDIGSSPVTSSETYRGTSVFSEKETQVVRDFVISRQFSIIHNFHTYSNLELWPWGFERTYTPYEELFRIIGDSLTQYNNYTPEVGWGLYTTNGAADDWAWGDTLSKPRCMSFTVEIGNGTDGFWPNPSRIPTLVQENLFPNMFLAKIADNPYQLAPPAPPTVDTPILADDDYDVIWHHSDTLNPAVSHELFEMTNKSTVTEGAEVDAGDWEKAKFTQSSARVKNGTKSWYSGTFNSTNHFLQSTVPYDVPAGDSLVFWIWYNIELDYDYFYAQVSTDGGFMFVNLPGNFTTNTNPNNVNLGNGITGVSGGWVQAKYSLAGYAGQQIMLRLSYLTDGGVLNEGVYLDDIENVDRFGSIVSLVSSADTSYFFTDKSPGTYWYRAISIDAQGQGSRYSNVVKAFIPVPYIVGDANHSGGINIVDLTYLVGYLFNGGALPNPPASGDCNCSGGINIVDLTFLVQYLFAGGAVPSCP